MICLYWWLIETFKIHITHIIIYFRLIIRINKNCEINFFWHKNFHLLLSSFEIPFDERKFLQHENELRQFFMNFFFFLHFFSRDVLNSVFIHLNCFQDSFSFLCLRLNLKWMNANGKIQNARHQFRLNI